MELFFLSSSSCMPEMMEYFNVGIWQQWLFNSNGFENALSVDGAVLIYWPHLSADGVAFLVSSFHFMTESFAGT